MRSAVTWFDPPPRPGDLPARFPSPFDPGPAHPLARRAGDQLLAELRATAMPALDEPGGGKMFGVLVVAGPEGRIGYLRAFSGMLAGRWHVDGYAAPLFDPDARAAFWPAGEAELRVLDEQIAALRDQIAPLRVELDAITARHAAALAELRALHQARRALRHQARAQQGPTHALDQESRGDTAERRRLDAAHATERAPVAARLAVLDEQRATIEHTRADRSRHYLMRIHETYVLPSASGQRRSLRELFAPEEPPGGAGDCAAPKLLAEAYRRGLRPIALAEVWWGAAPLTGGRHAGQYYPACRGKCGPILPAMLDGLAFEVAPLPGAGSVAADQPRLVFEDRWLIVVDKPCGLLSVPGRHALLRDSVQVRLRARDPHATGPMIVHRLDLDTSGLMLAARDAETHATLQRLFARRQVDKRYVAWLDGEVAADHGTIELALRVDLDDRPRQIHDPVHGKAAITEWRVLDRAGGRTRVALFPRTGRTHQLRVHAAHALGLGAPIVGDRLYGRADARLMLHAEALSFEHPHTSSLVALVAPAPF